MAFFSSHGMSNHHFEGEYVWNMLKPCFFPTKKLCVIKERLSFLVSQKEALFKGPHQPWCSPHCNHRVFDALLIAVACHGSNMLSLIQVTCPIGQSGPQFSFRSGFRCIVPWRLKRGDSLLPDPCPKVNVSFSVFFNSERTPLY